MNQAPQLSSPKKGGSPLRVVLIGATLLFGSCVSVCGYEIYRAETPEGKRETKEREEKDMATLEAFVAKVGRIRSSLPKEGDAPLKCPAGTTAKLPPVVDTLYLGALLDPPDGKRAVSLSTSELLRSTDALGASEFPDSVVNAMIAVHGGDAGPLGFLAPGQATVAIGAIDKHPVVVVLRVDEVSAPKIDKTAFTGGELKGDVAVIDWKTEKVACHGPVEALSSSEVSFGGGMRLKVGGIPVGTVGASQREDAIRKDFRKNVEAAVKKALGEIGAG